MQRLVAAINEQLWVGHFDLWTHTGMVMHRQALVLPGGLTASTAQCEAMVVNAIHACERYYPAFQFVVWAGKSTAEAMAAAPAPFTTTFTSLKSRPVRRQALISPAAQMIAVPCWSS